MTSDSESLLLDRIRDLLAKADPASVPPERFLGEQFDAGLAWVHFPEGEGGLGLEPHLQAIVQSELTAAGAPDNNDRVPIGRDLAAPTIAAHGTPDQRHRFLRPLFTTEEVWCQLFSEPGAGSDLAGLATRATRDGDEWIITGQKVWSTQAHLARWGILLARTDTEVPKHSGLTYFVCDMNAAGVDVRPLRQITGDAEFNEVFLSEVRIHDRHRLGAEGRGWHVAIATLMNERTSISGFVAPPRGSGPIAQAVRIHATSGDDPVARDRLARRWIEAETNRLATWRSAEARSHSDIGSESSVLKLSAAETRMRIYELSTDLAGMHGQLYGSYEMTRPEGLHLSFEDHEVSRGLLHTRSESIAGGTSEIMRSIIGERLLGLPGEPRIDKDQPWSEVPR